MIRRRRTTRAPGRRGGDRPSSPGRRGRALLAVVVALVSLVTVSPVGAAGPDSGNGEAKVEPGVRDEIAKRGEAAFWVILRQRADLEPASSIEDWEARGRFVVERLQRTAEESQPGLRGLLRARGVAFTPFWIMNTIRVTAGEAVLREVAGRPEVEEILAARTYRISDPAPKVGGFRTETVDWNIARIRAPEAWATFGTRGDGVVVASIDTGVMYAHPALVAQYRGRLPNGTFDHNYNWFDPSRVCGNPSPAPCDNQGHGTHTMGTMAGDDGDPGPNQIGVAPHARWIAAKGCESNFCSDAALLASGQWMLAPTDLDGQNPRPDLRPHVVNNSWGSSDGSDPFYLSTVQAWAAAGIFAVFANGNDGPSCGTVGSPASYPESYGVGAFDILDNIAFFSSRGPSPFGGIKPNIAAPGVGVRSSWNDGTYRSLSGTSMAAPHVAGTVALMWSAASQLVGRIPDTRSTLDRTAVDAPDASCGGAPENNNVSGEGRLDAFAAVEQSPRGPAGTLAGIVTDGATLLPVAGARIRAVGPSTRTTTTDALGLYRQTLPVGTYDLTASAFGYRPQTARVEVGELVTPQTFSLAAAPRHAVSGVVRDPGGRPVPAATVEIVGTPVPPAAADSDGRYRFDAVPEGEYEVQAGAGRCMPPVSQPLVVDGDETLDFTLVPRFDAFGYTCRLVPFAFVDASNVLPLTGDDASIPVALPFPFPFYGRSYTTAHVATNGFLNFLASEADYSNRPIPDTEPPNGAVYPFWDDLFVEVESSVRTEVLGAAPNRRLVIEWRNVSFFDDPTRHVRFEVVLHEDGRILTQYAELDDALERGASATVGIEDHLGTVALQYSFNEAALSNSAAVLYEFPPSAVEGRVTDFNDGLPLSGATVRAVQGGQVARQAGTDGEGRYRMHVPLGPYELVASASNYGTQSAPAVVDVEGEVVTVDFSLRTARGTASPSTLEFVVPTGRTRTQLLTVSNTGSLDLTWEIREAGGGALRIAGSAAAPLENPTYDRNAPTTEGRYLAGAPTGWSPSAPGDVIRSWPPAGLALAWGVGYTGDVWLSDVFNNRNHEFSILGGPTGRGWGTPWAAAWPADMAYDPGRGLMCQVNVDGDNGIHCWDPNTGTVVASITGAFPWTQISQRGLAYRPDDDTFYVGGWNQGVLYQIKGLSYPDKGAVIGQCNPPDGSISGLAWNPASNIIWEATNSPSDTIYELNPETCAVLATLPHPDPGFDGAGLEVDEAGNLWMIDQEPNTVYLVESGVPAFVDVPWLREDVTRGALAPGASQTVAVTVNTVGLEPGVYSASLFLQSNSGRQPSLRIPVSLVVPAYVQAVDAGDGPYTDLAGDVWDADRQHSAGAFGYTDPLSRTASTRSAITGADDDPLYQTLREDPGEYRFDGLGGGVYQVDLLFAEIQNRQPGSRLFDVIIEGSLVLPSHDIAAEVGTFAADRHTFFVTVGDGQLNVRFVGRRGYLPPIVNALRVTHRPDRS